MDCVRSLFARYQRSSIAAPDGDVDLEIGTSFSTVPRSLAPAARLDRSRDNTISWTDHGAAMSGIVR